MSITVRLYRRSVDRESELASQIAAAQANLNAKLKQEKNKEKRAEMESKFRLEQLENWQLKVLATQSTESIPVPDHLFAGSAGLSIPQFKDYLLQVLHISPESVSRFLLICDCKLVPNSSRLADLSPDRVLTAIIVESGQSGDKVEDESEIPASPPPPPPRRSGVPIELLAQNLHRLISPQVVQPLIDMGFPEIRAVKALMLNLLHPELAMEWLLNHSEDEDVDAPLSLRQLQQIARMFGIALPPQIPPEVETAIDNSLCTFTVTRNTFAPQIYYHCHTCAMNDGRGICVSCSRVCHRGHQLSDPIETDSFFCDCGAGDGPNPCTALRPQTQPVRNRAPSSPSLSQPSIASERRKLERLHESITLNPHSPLDFISFLQPIRLDQLELPRLDAHLASINADSAADVGPNSSQVSLRSMLNIYRQVDAFLAKSASFTEVNVAAQYPLDSSDLRVFHSLLISSVPSADLIPALELLSLAVLHPTALRFLLASSSCSELISTLLCHIDPNQTDSPILLAVLNSLINLTCQPHFASLLQSEPQQVDLIFASLDTQCRFNEEKLIRQRFGELLRNIAIQCRQVAQTFAPILAVFGRFLRSECIELSIVRELLLSLIAVIAFHHPARDWNPADRSVILSSGLIRAVESLMAAKDPEIPEFAKLALTILRETREKRPPMPDIP